MALITHTKQLITIIALSDISAILPPICFCGVWYVASASMSKSLTLQVLDHMIHGTYSFAARGSAMKNRYSIGITPFKSGRRRRVGFPVESCCRIAVLSASVLLCQGIGTGSTQSDTTDRFYTKHASWARTLLDSQTQYETWWQEKLDGVSMSP